MAGRRSISPRRPWVACPAQRRRCRVSADIILARARGIGLLIGYRAIKAPLEARHEKSRHAPGAAAWHLPPCLRGFRPSLTRKLTTDAEAN